MRPRTVISLLLFLLATSSLTAQPFEWIGARAIGGSSEDFVNAVAVDREGNVLVTGGFRGMVVFGGDTIRSRNSDRASTISFFLAKLDRSLRPIWIRNSSSERSEERNGAAGTALAVDAEGNIVVSGYGKGTLTFGDRVLKSTLENDLFIAKYSSDGALLWVHHTSGMGSRGQKKRAYEEREGYVRPSGLAFDDDGSYYLTGIFTGALPLGDSIYYERFPHTSSFLARFDRDGTLRWARILIGGGETIASSIAASPDGTVVVAGHVQQNHQMLMSEGRRGGAAQMFLGKYGRDGSRVWLRQFGVRHDIPHPSGGPGDVAALGVAVDRYGAISLNGFFNSPIELGDRRLDTLSAEGAMFVARYTGDGTLRWVRALHGTESQRTAGLCVDSTGACWISGRFLPQTSFGDTSAVFNPEVVVCGRGNDIVVARLDTTGRITGTVRAQAASYSGNRQSPAPFLAAGPRGDIYAAGDFLTVGSPDGFYPDAEFGTLYLESLGYLDIFIARLAPPSFSSLITGTVYNDLNRNGSRDRGEEALSGIRVRTGSDAAAITDSSGRYRIFIDSGSVAIGLVQDSTLTTITRTDGSIIERDFAITYPEARRDLRVSLHERPSDRPALRPHRLYTIFFENRGTVTANGTVQLTVASPLSFVAAYPAPSTRKGKTMTWGYENFRPGEERCITVKLIMPEDGPEEPAVALTATIEPRKNDATGANNQAEIRWGGSFYGMGFGTDIAQPEPSYPR